MKHLLKITIAVLFLFWFSACNHQKEISKEITLRLEPSEDNPRNSEGDFIQLNDGRILFIYSHFTSGSGDNSSAYLAGRYSSDGGKTWSSEDVKILSNEGGMNVMSVSLIRLDKNKIALFYLRKNSETDCIPLMRVSNDEAKTWSEAKECITDVPGYYVMNNDRVIKLKNGRIILPLSLHNTPESDGWFNGRLICYYSDDQGNTWTKGGEVPNPNNVTSQEPGLIELKNGKLLQFCRTDAGVQYVSLSEDYGETWTELRPSNIKSPLSPASIERIPQTGDLMLVWNNNYKHVRDGGNRTPFNLAISRDDGVTWEKIKTIESDPNGWYCYTAIEFVGDHVLLGHCAGDRTKNIGLATTNITRLNLDWIYSEATPAPTINVNESGIVELNCIDKDAKIYYSLDRKMPDKLYDSPIKITRTTPLWVQAVSKGKSKSELITTYVGINIFQPSLKVPSSKGAGLTYDYYEGDVSSVNGIEKLPVKARGVIGSFNINNRMKDENIAYIFNGFIEIPKDGKYTFYLASNDGSMLLLDNHELINHDGPLGMTEESNTVALRKGKHKIELKYFQLRGGLGLKLSWKGPGFKKEEIPESVLSH